MAKNSLEKLSCAAGSPSLAGKLAAAVKPVATAIRFVIALITGWPVYWNNCKEEVVLLQRRIPKTRLCAATPDTPPAANSAQLFDVLSAKLPAPEYLTEREEVVLMLILSRRTVGEIAQELCISQNTVRTHFRRICAKFYVGTKSELLEMAGATELSDRLTYREREVLQYVTAGKSDSEIAELLYISTNTVRSHIFNIRKKFDLDERCELSALADDIRAVS